MDIVYVYKRDKLDGLELRYSLRSLEKNLPYDKVFIIGDKPLWTRRLIHIKYQEKGYNKFHNINCKISSLRFNKELSENFCVMWDDIMVMNPIDTIKNYGTSNKLSESIANAMAIGKNRKHILTVERVFKAFPEGLNCECHHPYVYNKGLLRQLFGKYKLRQENPYALHSMYCNMFGLDMEYVDNCKVTNIEQLENKINLQTDYISTNFVVAKEKEFKIMMEKKFPKKSKFEM